MNIHKQYFIIISHIGWKKIIPPQKYIISAIIAVLLPKQVSIRAKMVKKLGNTKHLYAIIIV
jgi:hypothetical protein